MKGVMIFLLGIALLLPWISLAPASPARSFFPDACCDYYSSEGFPDKGSHGVTHDEKTEGCHSNGFLKDEDTYER